jgi:hypothetical protein
MQEINYTEKRKEPRFGITLKARIDHDFPCQEKSCEATIEDISLYGVKSITGTYLTPGQKVWISYSHTPEAEKDKILQGRVKWCGNGNNRYRLGIELFDKNCCSLSLEQASNCLKPLPQETMPAPEVQTLLKFFPQDLFHFELVWGLKFLTFQETLQDKLSRLTFNIYQSAAHLENILEESRIKTLSREELEQLNSTQSQLSRSALGFQRLVNLFRMMRAENIQTARQRHENLPEIIELDKRIQDRLKVFQEKLEYMMIPGKNSITVQSNKTSLFAGSAWRIDQGLDLMLLHSYQFLLFGNAKRVHIRLWQEKELLGIDFHHNGSGFMSRNEKQLVLRLDQDMGLCFQPGDKRQMAWLYYVLFFFREFDPSIIMRSEPGNNLVSLRLRPFD